MKTLSKYLNESLILEMSNINKINNLYLPSNSYKIIIWENDHKPPHVHVKKDGYNVKFLIETGEFNGYGENSRKMKSHLLNKLKNNFKLWLKDKHVNISNQYLAYSEWIRIFKSNKGFSKEFIDKIKQEELLQNKLHRFE